jgi:hypothetical protein
MGHQVFNDWTSSQTINVPFVNQAAADAVWDNDAVDAYGVKMNWRYGCNAKINYNG